MDIVPTIVFIRVMQYVHPKRKKQESVEVVQSWARDFFHGDSNYVNNCFVH